MCRFSLSMSICVSCIINQDDVDQRFQHQEVLYSQNMKLWELVKSMYDNDDWKAAQDEMDRLNKVIIDHIGRRGGGRKGCVYHPSSSELML